MELDPLLERLTAIIPMLLSLSVHEWAHAWTAWKLGDDTAKMMGRVSLNPLDHIDPVGTVLLPLIGVPFGWAKPVPVNPVRFRSTVSMSFGMLLTAAAGPISNLFIALGASAAYIGMVRSVAIAGPPSQFLFDVMQLLSSLALINVLLACFNLLPIPPLDGSRIVDALIPVRMRPAWNRYVAAGPFVLAAAILVPFALQINVWAWPARQFHLLLIRFALG